MKYNFKLLYSPIKWLSCFIFIIIIPIAMYAPSYYDFINLATIYISFIGVVLFTDIALIDKNNGVEEITYISNGTPIKTFIQRFIITLMLLIVYVILANLAYRVLFLINYPNQTLLEPITLIEYVLIVTSSALMLGIIAMTISNITNNLYIGYGTALLYWLYWNVNLQIESIFNLFPFIANPTYYEKHLLLQIIWIVLVVIFNITLSKKGPYFIEEKIRRMIYRF